MRSALHSQRTCELLAHRRNVSAIAAIFLLAVLLLLSTTSCPRPIADIDHHLHSALPEKQLISISISSPHEVLQVICKHSLYPTTCMQELSSFKVSSPGNPLELVSLYIKAAAARAQEALKQARHEQRSSVPGLYDLKGQCTSDCTDLMESTKEYLDMVVATLSNMQGAGAASLSSSLLDIKVWLSSALSYQAACSDGFALVPGSMQPQMQSTQDYLAQVIGNGLSLVDFFSHVGNNLGSWSGNLPPIPPLVHRRLLSHPTVNFPSWVSPTQRHLLQTPPSAINANNVVVAQDGSGNFTNITAAIHSLPKGHQGRYVIYVKQGVYDEVFNVTKHHNNITLLGDGVGLTVITGNRSVSSGKFNTYRTSTVGVSGSGFSARDITFRNTAGASGHQAVALRASADLLVFYRCSFEGYQDTLYALSGRQFYRECTISGTVDFIFGNAIAMFQNCELVARLPLELQQNTYTAQGRKLAVDVSGFAFQNCTLTGDSSLQNATYSVSTYLGRPWKAFSRVVFMQSQMEGLVQAQGWTPWNESNPFTDTLFYGEFQNRGSGSSTAQRVAWAGVHPNMTQDQAAQFTFDNFIGSETWLSYTSLL